MLQWLLLQANLIYIQQRHSVVAHLLEGVSQLLHPDHVGSLGQQFGPHKFNKVLKVDVTSH